MTEDFLHSKEVLRQYTSLFLQTKNVLQVQMLSSLLCYCFSVCSQPADRDFTTAEHEAKESSEGAPRQSVVYGLVFRQTTYCQQFTGLGHYSSVTYKCWHWKLEEKEACSIYFTGVGYFYHSHIFYSFIFGLPQACKKSQKIVNLSTAPEMRNLQDQKEILEVTVISITLICMFNSLHLLDV